MNCRFSLLGDDGESGHQVEWKIGKLYWLPRMTNEKLRMKNEKS
jgi:hypothetical protein